MRRNAERNWPLAFQDGVAVRRNPHVSMMVESRRGAFVSIGFDPILKADRERMDFVASRGRRHGHLMRAVPIGSRRLDPGDPLLDLRGRCLDASERMAELVWRRDPLAELPAAKEFGRELLEAQSLMRPLLNSVWAEKMRVDVAEHVERQHGRRFGRVVGRLRHVQELGGDGLSKCLPKDAASRLSSSDLGALAAFAEGRWGDLRRAMSDGEGKGCDGLSEAAREAIMALAEEIGAAFGRPRYGRTGEEVVALPLDYKAMPQPEGRKDVLDQVAAEMDLVVKTLLDGGAVDGFDRTSVLSIAGNVARADRHVLGLRPESGLFGRHLPLGGKDAASIGTFTVEIGPREASVKAILSKPPPEPPSGVRWILGRDFGYTDTVALSLVRLFEEMPLDRLSDVPDFGEGVGQAKIAAKAWFEAAVPEFGSEEIARIVVSGRRFLARLAVHAEAIDRLRSEIDLGYARLDRLREAYGLAHGVEGPFSMVRGFVPGAGGKGGKAAKWHGRFFRLLDALGRLKAARRDLYRRVAAVKRNWFGFLSNLEVGLVAGLEGGAAVVREDLTVMAVGKESPAYKGRTFNKMIDNGSKGQYIRRAADKHAWNGTPEVKVPSYHTSSVCVPHRRVSKSMRRGKIFFCPECRAEAKAAGRPYGPEHADGHASWTIALHRTLHVPSSVPNPVETSSSNVTSPAASAVGFPGRTTCVPQGCPV